MIHYILSNILYKQRTILRSIEFIKWGFRTKQRGGRPGNSANRNFVE